MDDATFRQDLLDLMPSLRGYARALARNTASADDLVQETLYRALRAKDQFRPGTDFRSWVFRIERNAWFNEWRRQRREEPGIAAETHPGCTAADQDWKMQQSDMLSALARLKPEHRHVLLSVAARGTSYCEAARQANCEIGTVKSRLNRAREALASELGLGPNLDPSPGFVPGPASWSSWQTVRPT